MKKLALALMCLVSVAFFASCNPDVVNPEPSIAIMTGDNFVYDGQTIDLGTEYQIGFRAASNSQTSKELSKFNVLITFADLESEISYSSDTTINISGTEYVFQETLSFGIERELVAKVVVTATVTDVDGKTNSATINLNLNQPAQPLVASAFTWNRHGGDDATGLDEFGLKWERNLSKAIYAVIEPVDGAILYKFDPSVWNTTTTDLEKAALFSEATPADPQQWKEFNVAGATTQEFDVVLGTAYQGEFHLIHITKGTYYTFKGTDATIEGEAK